jgi:hypothetical protein
VPSAHKAESGCKGNFTASLAWICDALSCINCDCGSKGTGFDGHLGQCEKRLFPLSIKTASSGGFKVLGPYSPISRDAYPHLPFHQCWVLSLNPKCHVFKLSWFNALSLSVLSLKRPKIKINK